MRVTLEEAVALLKKGELVAIPTETVYGLAACLEDVAAIQKIYQVKGRPAQNPLIVHLTELGHYVKTRPPYLQQLVEAFWPGPMTLVLEQSQVPEIARAGLPTAAFRVPNHPLTQQILQQTGPLVMPSANLSGRPSSTLPEHVESDFGPHFPVLEGETTLGLESTVLRFADRWEIIRLGALPPEAFETVLGYVPEVRETKKGESPACPGQLFRHYAPAAQLLPLKDNVSGIVVGFSDRHYNATLYSLGSSQDPEAVAENLYATLRRLDEEGVQQAWIDLNIPQEGLWKTISQRLQKAVFQ